MIKLYGTTASSVEKGTGGLTDFPLSPLLPSLGSHAEIHGATHALTINQGVEKLFRGHRCAGTGVRLLGLHYKFKLKKHLRGTFCYVFHEKTPGRVRVFGRPLGACPPQRRRSDGQAQCLRKLGTGSEQRDRMSGRLIPPFRLLEARFWSYGQNGV